MICLFINHYYQWRKKNVHIGENYEKEEGECEEDEEGGNTSKKKKIEEDDDDDEDGDINIEELEKVLSEAGLTFEKI